MKYCLPLILISAFLLSSCAKSSETSQNASANPENSAVIAQSDNIESPNSVPSESTPTFVAERATSSTYNDVTVMKDGYGNTVETRYFSDHSRILSVIVRTHATGEKVASVYGRNGEVRPLPAYKIGDAFTEDPSRLADIAGIWEGKKQTPENLPPVRTVVSENLPPAASLPEPVAKPEETKKENSDASTDNPPVTGEKSANQSETKSDAVLPNPKNSEQ